MALMISTFSVSMMTGGVIRSLAKKSSTMRRVIDPVSKSTNGCFSRSAGTMRFCAASGWLG